MTTPQTHRPLSEGEIIQDGDEFGSGSIWTNCREMIGRAITRLHVGHYRRPLPAQQHVETPTPRTEIEIPEEIQRLLDSTPPVTPEMMERLRLAGVGCDASDEDEPTWAKIGNMAERIAKLETENKRLRSCIKEEWDGVAADKILTDVERIHDAAIPALKAAYARGHYCDMGDRCPGCIAGHALEQITGRKWMQEECG